MAKKRKGMSKAYLTRLRKKHHLGEFAKRKNAKHKLHSVYKKAKRKPLKRKATYSRSMARKKRRSSPSRSAKYGKMIGIVGYVIAEPFIDQLTSKFNIGVADDFVKLGVGFAISKYLKNPIAKSVGEVMMIIAGVRIVEGIKGGSFGNLFNSNSNSNSGENW